MTARGRGFLATLIGLGLVIGAAAPADAQKETSGVTTQVGFDQKLGARLPLAAHFRDESGRELPLGDYFGRRPVILVPLYYGCPLLCVQLLAGLTRGLKPLSLDAGKDFDVIAFSIDPSEGPALALSKKTAYLERYDRPGTESGWHFLTGDEANIKALSDSVDAKFATNDSLNALKAPSLVNGSKFDTMNVRLESINDAINQQVSTMRELIGRMDERLKNVEKDRKP